jgi:hypothetical protein
MESGWQFVPDDGLRRNCGHWWSGQYIAADGHLHTWAKRCTHEGKFRRGFMWRCGYHTPGVGRKGPRRVKMEGIENVEARL